MTSTACSIQRFCLALLMVIGVAWTSLAAEKEKPELPAPPPQPMAQKVKVKRGEMIEIPLKIHGVRNQTLTFLIRRAPEHGKLSVPKNTGQDEAVVTYEAPTEYGLMSDRFTFAVKSREGVSAPVEVQISITEPPPILVIPDEIKFQPTLIGQSATQQLEISNRGGGFAEGRITVDQPWSVTEDAEYRIGASERAVFQLVFSPAQPGSFSTEVRFSSHADRVTTLRGEAMMPIAAVPSRVELKVERVTNSRYGGFELINHTATEQEITLSASETLEFERKTALAPGERKSISIKADEKNPVSFEEEITIKAPGGQTSVKVFAPALPAFLRPHPASLRFGDVPVVTRTERIVIVENAGGQPVSVSASGVSPFSVEPGTAEIAPNTRQRFRVAFSAAIAGEVQGSVQFTCDAHNVQVPVSANVSDAARGSMPSRRSATGAPPIRNREKEEVRTISTRRTGTSSGALPGLPARIVRVTQDSALIQWPAFIHEAARYAAEERQLALENGKLTTNWISFHSVAIERKGDQVQALFSKLEPGQVHAMRIRPINAQGAVEEPLFQITFRTTPAPERGFRFTLLRALILLLIVCVAAVVWKRRKQSQGPRAGW